MEIKYSEKDDEPRFSINDLTKDEFISFQIMTYFVGGDLNQLKSISDFTKLSTIKYFEDEKRNLLLATLGEACLEKFEILEDIKDYDIKKFVDNYSLVLKEFVDKNDEIAL